MPGFLLSALIADISLLGGFSRVLPRVRLVGDLHLLPVPRSMAGVLGDDTANVPGFRTLREGLAERARLASVGGSIAYVEASFTGGLGGQSSVVWAGSEIALGPLLLPEGTRPLPAIAEWPINRALRHLGVARRAGLDEFDTLRLGRHHRVEDWLYDGERPKPEVLQARATA